MNQKEIDKYSKLMAEFEGSDRKPCLCGDPDCAMLTYDTSYDELMRVWAKFRDLQFKVSSIARMIHSYKVQMICNCLTHKSRLDAFLELGRAIKWYSKLKHKTNENN